VLHRDLHPHTQSTIFDAEWTQWKLLVEDEEIEEFDGNLGEKGKNQRKLLVEAEKIEESDGNLGD